MHCANYSGHCGLPDESARWVERVSNAVCATPQYRRIVETIEELQKKYKREPVRYAALRVELSHLSPAINYATDEEIAELCKAMAQMAPGAIFATAEKVEVDQSAENVIGAIEATTQEYPPKERQVVGLNLEE